ncbi:MAG: protein involved in polysaccharide export with SLBB domain [Pseudoalteromonas tetraodonis]|jgi:protein involved in polysaccharide export with SLBB domain
MKLLSKLLLVLLFVLPTAALAQETALKSGQSFGLRISGVPGDEVALVSAMYGISDAGTIKLPYLKSAITAAGLKPSDLARKIEAAYRTAQIYTQPTIQVDSNTATTKESRFLSVVGEVKAPRSVNYAPGLTLLDAIAQCGGFTDFADEKKIKVTRAGKVTYHNLSKSAATENVKLQPNDIVTVKPGGGLFRR